MVAVKTALLLQLGTPSPLGNLNQVRLSPPECRYADVLGLSDWPRYPDSGLAEPKGNKLHDLR